MTGVTGIFTVYSLLLETQIYRSTKLDGRVQRRVDFGHVTSAVLDLGS